jgi:hypothetical protein
MGKPHVVRGIGDAEAHARDLAQVLDQIGEAVIVKDLNAVVTYWSTVSRQARGSGPGLRRRH